MTLHVQHPPLPLFVYGSLMWSEVMHTLLNRVPTSHPATLQGWVALALPDECYPVLVQKTEHVTTGKLYTDLSAEERDTLHRFENPIYSTTPITVQDYTGTERAYCYAISQTQAEELGAVEPWSPENFTTHIPSFLHRCHRFVEVLKSSTPHQ